MEQLYEVALEGRIVKLDRDTWDKIRTKIRNNDWFYLVHIGQKYTYEFDRTFFDRPTIFYFKVVKDCEEKTIEYIYI